MRGNGCEIKPAVGDYNQRNLRNEEGSLFVNGHSRTIIEGMNRVFSISMKLEFGAVQVAGTS